MSEAAVRVGIVSYNTADLLGACLDALPDALSGLAAEVVVVDNASTDGSQELLAARSDVLVVQNDENVGYARAMNRALDGSAAPVLIALNPDTRPEPGSLSALVTSLREQPDVGLLAPRLVNADGSLQHSAYRFPSVRLALILGFAPHRFRGGALGRRFWLEGTTQPDHPADVDWVIGAVHVIRAAALAGAEPYSERWFMYAEDMELCWRVHEGGWRVLLDPAVSVPHVGNAAGAKSWNRLAREERHLDATYDWYVTARGAGAARGWAAAQVAGLELKRAVLRTGSADAARAEYRDYLGDLAAFHRGRVRDPRTTGLAASRPGGGNS